MNAAPDAERPWSWLQCVAFRVLLLFWLLQFAPPSPLTLLPVLPDAIAGFWSALASRLGGLLGLVVPQHAESGSGDTMKDWLAALAALLLALGGAALWSLLQRRPVRHGKLLDFFQLFLRVVLVQTLLVYGVIKLFGQQFPAPGADRLLSTYAESSPMGLMWVFMGASLPYQQFAGAMEMLAGLLLIFRRTSTLGALLAAGVMGNVFVLNLCFDVPVKLFSGQLLLMSLFLVSLDAARLLDLLVFNRATQPADRSFRFWGEGRWRWLRHAVVTTCMVAGAVDATQAAAGGPGPESPDPITGAYEVVSSEGLEGLSRFGFTSGDARLFFSDGTTLRLKVALTPREHRVVLSPRNGEPGLEANLVREEGPSPGLFTFSGRWQDAPVSLRVRARDLSSPLLLTRGFHWVNEFPFNR